MAFINKLAKALGVVDDGDLGYYGEWMMSREEAQAKYDERLENMVIDKIEALVQSIKPKEREKIIIEDEDWHHELQNIMFICVRKYGMMKKFQTGDKVILDFYQSDLDEKEKEVIIVDQDENYYYCKEV